MVAKKCVVYLIEDINVTFYLLLKKYNMNEIIEFIEFILN